MSSENGRFIVANPSPLGLLQVVFLSLATLFFLLSAGDFTDMAEITRVGGAVGIFCGLSAMYCSLAQVINELYGKTVMPL